jgi:hypothetical protein
MRRSALAVAVVTMFTMALALAGSAGAAVKGSVWDPADVPPEVLADGTRRHPAGSQAPEGLP